MMLPGEAECKTESLRSRGDVDVVANRAAAAVDANIDATEHSGISADQNRG